MAVMEKHKGLAAFNTDEDNKFAFASTNYVFTDIYMCFWDFFDKLEVVSLFVKMDLGRLSYLLEQKYRDLESLEEEFQAKGVELKLYERLHSTGFVLKGNKGQCKDFISRLV